MSNTKLRSRLLASFGNACQRCGYDRCLAALHFHHRDAADKQHWSGNRGKASLAEVTAHPEHFVLLCANCHLEEHVALRKPKYRACLHCGKPVLQTPFRASQNRGQYCSHACYHAHRAILAGTDAVERFWARVQKTDNHWLWLGSTDPKSGLPKIEVREASGGWTSRGARNVSYELAYGSLPPRANLSVTCGEPLCVRHDHLAWRAIKR